MKIVAKLILLPTLFASRLMLGSKSKQLFLAPSNRPYSEGEDNRELYVISNRPIKKWDWYVLLPENKVKRAQADMPTHKDWKKIEATTDPHLKDKAGYSDYPSVPDISEELISEYCKSYNDDKRLESCKIRATVENSEITTKMDGDCLSIVFKQPEQSWEGLKKEFDYERVYYLGQEGIWNWIESKFKHRII
jgi:hypothetical protein